MARGWESKSVESQQESAAAARAGSSPRDDPQARMRRQEQERGDLELSRTRILRELAAAVHPRHREQLEAALRHLDSKIAETNGPKAS